jgi:hypothetical protein
LLVEQQLAQLEELVEQLVVRKQLALLEQLVEQAHLQVLQAEMQLVLKLLLVKILELVEFHPLVHQRQVLLVLLMLMKLVLLVSKF